MLYCSKKKMELIGTSSDAVPHQNHSSRGSSNAGNKNLTEKEVYVNHAELAWHQMRTEWVGDQSKKLRRSPKGSTLSVTRTYEEVLASREPFKRPILLSVGFIAVYVCNTLDFLVKLWLLQLNIHRTSYVFLN
ncbi:hypothetical protein GmHk_03G008331 [Glycine max]|nr:hypothetical protein GmHk_03G008331 [Glycine max]